MHSISFSTIYSVPFFLKEKKHLKRAFDTTNSSNTLIFQNFRENLKSNKQKLNAYKLLKENWNLNGALPFKTELLEKIQELLFELNFQPKIFPTARGSIQFEYEKPNGDYLEFEIYEDHVVYLLQTDSKSQEAEIEFDLITFQSIIDSFYVV